MVSGSKFKRKSRSQSRTRSRRRNRTRSQSKARSPNRKQRGNRSRSRSRSRSRISSVERVMKNLKRMANNRLKHTLNLRAHGLKQLKIALRNRIQMQAHHRKKTRRNQQKLAKVLYDRWLKRWRNTLNELKIDLAKKRAMQKRYNRKLRKMHKLLEEASRQKEIKALYTEYLEKFYKNWSTFQELQRLRCNIRRVSEMATRKKNPKDLKRTIRTQLHEVNVDIEELKVLLNNIKKSSDKKFIKKSAQKKFEEQKLDALQNIYFKRALDPTANISLSDLNLTRKYQTKPKKPMVPTKIIASDTSDASDYDISRMRSIELFKKKKKFQGPKKSNLVRFLENEIKEIPKKKILKPIRKPGELLQKKDALIDMHQYKLNDEQNESEREAATRGLKSKKLLEQMSRLIEEEDMPHLYSKDSSAPYSVPTARSLLERTLKSHEQAVAKAIKPKIKKQRPNMALDEQASAFSTYSSGAGATSLQFPTNENESKFTIRENIANARRSSSKAIIRKAKEINRASISQIKLNASIADRLQNASSSQHNRPPRFRQLQLRQKQHRELREQQRQLLIDEMQVDGDQENDTELKQKSLPSTQFNEQIMNEMKKQKSLDNVLRQAKGHGSIVESALKRVKEQVERQSLLQDLFKPFSKKRSQQRRKRSVSTKKQKKKIDEKENIHPEKSENGSQHQNELKNFVTTGKGLDLPNIQSSISQEIVMKKHREPIIDKLIVTTSAPENLQKGSSQYRAGRSRIRGRIMRKDYGQTFKIGEDGESGIASKDMMSKFAADDAIKQLQEKYINPDISRKPDESAKPTDEWDDVGNPHTQEFSSIYQSQVVSRTPSRFLSRHPSPPIRETKILPPPRVREVSRKISIHGSPSVEVLDPHTSIKLDQPMEIQPSEPVSSQSKEFFDQVKERLSELPNRITVENKNLNNGIRRAQKHRKKKKLKRKILKRLSEKTSSSQKGSKQRLSLKKQKKERISENSRSSRKSRPSFESFITDRSSNTTISYQTKRNSKPSFRRQSSKSYDIRASNDTRTTRFIRRVSDLRESHFKRAEREARVERLKRQKTRKINDTPPDRKRSTMKKKNMELTSKRQTQADEKFLGSWLTHNLPSIHHIEKDRMPNINPAIPKPKREKKKSVRHAESLNSILTMESTLPFPTVPKMEKPKTRGFVKYQARKVDLKKPETILEKSNQHVFDASKIAVLRNNTFLMYVSKEKGTTRDSLDLDLKLNHIIDDIRRQRNKLEGDGVSPRDLRRKLQKSYIQSIHGTIWPIFVNPVLMKKNFSLPEQVIVPSTGAVSARYTQDVLQLGKTMTIDHLLTPKLVYTDVEKEQCIKILRLISSHEPIENDADLQLIQAYIMDPDRYNPLLRLIYDKHKPPKDDSVDPNMKKLSPSSQFFDKLGEEKRKQMTDAARRVREELDMDDMSDDSLTYIGPKFDWETPEDLKTKWETYFEELKKSPLALLLEKQKAERAKADAESKRIREYERQNLKKKKLVRQQRKSTTGSTSVDSSSLFNANKSKSVRIRCPECGLYDCRSTETSSELSIPEETIAPYRSLRLSVQCSQG